MSASNDNALLIRNSDEMRTNIVHGFYDDRTKHCPILRRNCINNRLVCSNKNATMDKPFFNIVYIIIYYIFG